MPIRKDLLEYRVDLTKQLKKIKDPDQRKRAAKIAGEEALKRIKEQVAKQKSPVTGNTFAKLNKNYAKYKKKIKGHSKADLSLTGDMLTELDMDFDQDSFTIFIDDPDETQKAYNHNVGDTVKKRPFIPDDSKNQKFHKASVRDKYEKKIKQFAKGLPKQASEQKESVSEFGLQDFIQTLSDKDLAKRFIDSADIGAEDIITTLNLDDFI